MKAVMLALIDALLVMKFSNLYGDQFILCAIGVLLVSQSGSY